MGHKGWKTETSPRYKDVWVQWTNVCLECGVERVGESRDEEGNIADSNRAGSLLIDAELAGAMPRMLCTSQRY